MADQRDAHVDEVADGEVTGLLHGDHARLHEGRDVAVHLDGDQPVLHRGDLGHVRHVGVDEVVRSVARGKERTEK